MNKTRLLHAAMPAHARAAPSACHVFPVIVQLLNPPILKTQPEHLLYEDIYFSGYVYELLSKIIWI